MGVGVYHERGTPVMPFLPRMQALNPPLPPPGRPGSAGSQGPGACWNPHHLRPRALNASLSSLELSDTNVYEPQIRAIAANLCKVAFFSTPNAGE